MKINELKNIIKEVLVEENIFVPRNIENRKEKIKQNILKKLDQKIIEGNIEIDCKYIPKNYIAKVEIINGDVSLKNCNSLLFLKNLKEVNGEFNCGYSDLSSLEGCPKNINGDFWCSWNKKRFKQSEVKKYCNVKGYTYL